MPVNTPSALRVATVQFQHRPGDKEYNLACIDKFIERARTEQVQILVLPEMCITGYWHVTKLPDEDVRALSEPLADSPSLRHLCARARNRYDYRGGAD